jgi:hypothetical protein
MRKECLFMVFLGFDGDGYREKAAALPAASAEVVVEALARCTGSTFWRIGGLWTPLQRLAESSSHLIKSICFNNLHEG